MESWPRILPERFDGEPLVAYKERAEQIREIITGFRMNLFEEIEAEQMEHRLLRLQNPLYADA